MIARSAAPDSRSPIQPSACTAVTGSGTSASSAQSSGCRWASASTSAAVGPVRREPARRRNSSPAASRCASTLTQRPRTRTSGALAATSSVSSSSDSSSSPTAIDQRKSASVSRPRPLRVSTRSAGVLRVDRVSPTRREPSQPAGSCTPNPAATSSGAPAVRNSWAPPSSSCSSVGRACRSAPVSGGNTAAARPSSPSSSSCGSASSRLGAAVPDLLGRHQQARVGVRLQEELQHEPGAVAGLVVRVGRRVGRIVQGPDLGQPEAGAAGTDRGGADPVPRGHRLGQRGQLPRGDPAGAADPGVRGGQRAPARPPWPAGGSARDHAAAEPG